MSSHKEMVESIPYDLRKSPQYQAIFKSEGKLIDEIIRKIEDILDQTYVDTATWGLEIWEREFEINTDLSKPLSERRSFVKSKKRGIGTVSVELVKSVAEAFYGGKVEVSEKPRDCLIEIKFVSSYGTPPNLKDVEKSVREIIPAHLDVNYSFSYFLVSDIHGMKISELEQQTLDKFAGGINVG